MTFVYKNLVPGQYQFGNDVVGKGTNVKVENFDVKPYEVNAGDYQRPRSSEVNFSQDSFKPTTIEIQMEVLYNRLLDIFAGTKPNFNHGAVTVDNLAATWRADSIREQWGQLMPIYFCGRDGVGKIIFGRPGAFTVEKVSEKSTGIKCQAEFRRMDTLAYSAKESAIQMTQNQNPELLWLGQGNVDSWIRIVGQGPMVNPVITIGDQTIQVNKTFLAGETFEISSYPYSRRAVDSNGNNIRDAVTGPYLVKLVVPTHTLTPVRWTAANNNTFVYDLGNHQWSVDINQMWKAPAGFDVKRGSLWTRLDLFNPDGPTLFLGGGEFLFGAAAVYTQTKFATAWQHLQAKITSPFLGRSALSILCNEAMTNYFLLEVVTDIGVRKMRLRIGTGNNAWGSVLSEYTHNENWSETDVFSIDYNPTTKVVTGSLNGVVKVTYTDSALTVSQSNRCSAVIFDMDNSLYTQGAGFRELIGYDTYQVAADTGKMYMFWRDCWAAIV